MKQAIKLTIKQYHNDKLISNKERLKCGYCESGFTYVKSKTKTLGCRECGKESTIPK